MKQSMLKGRDTLSVFKLSISVPDPDPLVSGMGPDPDPSIVTQTSKKNFDFYSFVTSF
jgi:hypothetical protein